MIRLAVVDMAGTTVRDDGLVESAFAEALQAVGLAPDELAAGGHLDVVRRDMGMSKIVVFGRLLGDEGRARLAGEAFDASIARRIADGEVAPLEGAAEALAALRAGGIRVCLTTGFGDRIREAMIDHLGWRDLVDLSLSPGPGVRGRPAPDLALTALMRLRVDSVHELATVGDTTADLLAGHRAGAAIVAGVLTGAHDRTTLGAAPHTHLLESVAELPGVCARARTS